MFLIMPLRNIFYEQNDNEPVGYSQFLHWNIGEKNEWFQILLQMVQLQPKKQYSKRPTVLSLEKQENNWTKEHQSRTIEIASKLFNLV